MKENIETELDSFGQCPRNGEKELTFPSLAVAGEAIQERER